MTESQRRHLTVSVRYIAQLIEEADRILSSVGRPSPSGSFDLDLTDSTRNAVLQALDDLRRDLLWFGERFNLDLRGQSISVRHMIRVQLSVASISVVEMRPRSLGGYGEIDPDSARDLDSACNQLEASVQRAQQIVDGADR